MLAALLVLLLGFLVLWILKRSERTNLHYVDTETNKALLNACQVVHAYDNIPLWGINGHFQSYYASQVRKGPKLPLERTTLTNDHGGSFAIDWLYTYDDPSVPLICFIPGIAGHTDNDYIKNFMNYCRESGVNVVCWNWPGCGLQLSHPQMKTLGDYRDLVIFFNHIAAKHPKTKLYAIGFSLGANLLLRYLGEVKDETPITAASAMCSGFCGKTGLHLLRENKLYSRVLAKKWKDVIAQNTGIYKDHPRIDLQRIMNAGSLEELDSHYSAKLFQEEYADVEDYYSQHSSLPMLKAIQRPTLILNSLDDPIIKGHLVELAKKESAENPHIILAYTKHGGHLGWIQSTTGIFPEKATWLDRVVIDFVKASHSVFS